MRLLADEHEYWLLACDKEYIQYIYDCVPGIFRSLCKSEMIERQQWCMYLFSTVDVVSVFCIYFENHVEQYCDSAILN